VDRGRGAFILALVGETPSSFIILDAFLRFAVNLLPMFTLSRVVILVLASILITTILYYLDRDPGTDNLMQRATVTALIFFVITMLYAGFYGLFRSFRRKRA